MRKYSSALPHLIAQFRSTTSSLMLPQWNRAFLYTVFTEIHHRMQCYPDIEGWYARSTFHPPTPAVLYDVRTTLCSAQMLCVFVCRSTHCVSKQRRRNCRHLFLINLNAGNSASWTEVIYQDFEIFFYFPVCIYLLEKREDKLSVGFWAPFYYLLIVSVWWSFLLTTFSHCEQLVCLQGLRSV